MCDLYTPTMGIQYFNDKVVGTWNNKVILSYVQVDCVRIRNKIETLRAFSNTWTVASWIRTENILTDDCDLCKIVCECIDFYIGECIGYMSFSQSANELERAMLIKFDNM